MGYSWKYDTNYDDETGEWLEKIGFCPEEIIALFVRHIMQTADRQQHLTLQKMQDKTFYRS